LLQVDLERFKGVFVALNACYDNRGEVSAGSVKKLCRFYEEKGIKGLYLCGSTGEGILQTVEERKKTVEAAAQAVGSRMTLITHVGAASTKDSIELAVHAEKSGAHALSAVPCIYYRLPEQSIERHLRSIIDSTDLPFIVYNIPQLTGYDLSVELLKRLLGTKKVIGVKNTTLSVFQTQQFKKVGGDDFIVFNGPDEEYLAGRSMGAEAGIGSTYSIMPELYLKLEDCIVNEKIREAAAWQVRINEIIEEMREFPSMYGIAKEILKLRGIDTGPPRLPLEAPAKSESGKIEKIYKRVMEYVEISYQE